MRQFHKIQREILKRLLFSKELRYTKLKPVGELENNQLDYHLDQLIGLKLIEKSEKAYRLTNKGKEFANRMDTEDSIIKLQAKISVWVAGVQQLPEQTKYLIATRLKNPFYGAQGFLAGKLKYGEGIYHGAKRELQEETGLTGEPELVQIRHYFVYDQKSNQLVEDKFMFLFRVVNPVGELIPNEEGSFDWLSEDEFEEKVQTPFEGYEEFIQLIETIKNYKGQVSFKESSFVTEKF